MNDTMRRFFYPFIILTERRQGKVVERHQGGVGYAHRFIVLAMAVLLTSQAYGVSTKEKGADKSQVAEEVRTLRLSVDDCVKLVIRHNLALLDAKLNPQIRDTDITEAKAEFDPAWEGEASKSRNIDEPITLFSRDVDKSEVIEFNTGFQQKLWTGTQWRLALNNNYEENNSGFRTLNKFYREEFALFLTQPLLKDFGIEINEMEITIAANNKKISIEELKRNLMDRIVSVIRIYWDLVFRLEDLEVNRILLQQAMDLEELNKAQVKAGILAPIGVLEAQASVASRQEGVLIAENNIQDARDNLLAVTNLAEENWDLLLMPSAKAKFEEVQIDLKKSISYALENRPEFKQTELELLNIDYNLRLAENDWWPSLNAFGSYGLNAVGEKYGDGLDNRFFSWTAGAEFTIPLGNRAANANILEQKLRRQQAEYNMRRIRIEIEREVREAYRQMITSKKRTQSNKIAEDLEKRKLEIEEEKLKLGLSTNKDVLDFQVDLAQARRRHIESIIDYKKSLAELSSRTGRLLEEHRITIKEFYPAIF